MIADSRSRWYSSLVSVCDGAITIESPVWMPSGSKFSMLHTVMQLPWPSRTTSYSTSFQPRRSRSTRICGDLVKDMLVSAMSSSSFSQKPEPRPPSANAARQMTG